MKLSTLKQNFSFVNIVLCMLFSEKFVSWKIVEKNSSCIKLIKVVSIIGLISNQSIKVSTAKRFKSDISIEEMPIDILNGDVDEYFNEGIQTDEFGSHLFNFFLGNKFLEKFKFHSL